MIQKSTISYLKSIFGILLLSFFVINLPLIAAGQKSFDKSEFAARRAKLIERTGDGAAVIFGNESHPYSVRFRQSPDFYYLTGIEEPNSVPVINGARKSSAVFVPKRSPQKIAAEGAGVVFNVEPLIQNDEKKIICESKIRF